MRARLFIYAIFALLLVGCTAVSAVRAQDERRASDPSLWIVVRDERGAPIKNACVTLVPREGEILFRQTDGKGRVRIGRLTRGQYRVTAKSDGYAAQKKEVSIGASEETVSFSLQPR
jgi:Carboxypeptidase regulatory-like domain